MTNFNSPPSTLKACPNVLCDLSRPRLEQQEDGMPVGRTWVQCENCGACGPRIENPSAYYGRTEEWERVKSDAITAWNTRTPSIEPSDVEKIMIETKRVTGRFVRYDDVAAVLKGLAALSHGNGE